jgi:alpha-N-arabinofuranosidase
VGGVHYLHAKTQWLDLRRQNGREQPGGLKYWGVGNENWGCGGNMSAEYYINSIAAMPPISVTLGRIVSTRLPAPHDGDTHWTGVDEPASRTRAIRWLAAGLSLHYYTLGAAWQNKLTATGLAKINGSVLRCTRMDELLTRHSTVMDKYDPEQEWVD